MLSLPHLVVLFVIALVVFGPEKLPELARKLGKATAEFRKMTNDFRYALEDEVRELDRQNRIREEESAANAVNVPPLPPIPPEFVMPRELSAPGSSAQPTVEPAAQVEISSENPAPPEAVSVPHEKPADDNTAV